MRTAFSLCIFIIIFCAETVHAQSSKTVYPHSVFWSKTEVNQLFNNGFGVGADFVYRRKNEMNQGSMFSSPLRESIRPWLHYQFSQYARFSVSPLGYMNTNEYVGKPADTLRPSYHELRTTFQFFHHHKQLGGRIMHTWRYRYEMRWQESADSENYRYFNRFRARYRIRYIFNNTDFYQDKVIYAAVSNEIGLNFGENVVLNIFNQNRLYAGIGYRFLNAARIEVRYVNRFRTRGATGYEFDNGQGIMLGLYIDQVSALGRSRIQPVRFAD